MLIAGTLSLTVTGAGADAVDLVTPNEAAADLAATYPNAVNSQPLAGDATAPILERTGDGFEVRGAQHSVTIGDNASDPLALETDSGLLKLMPQNVSDRSSQGEAVGDHAVLYANTGEDSDTAIKPTQQGLETFTNIRSDDAAEDFRWNVQLPGDEQLKQLSDGTVVVIDRSPAPPHGRLLPEPAKPGTAAGDTAMEESGRAVFEPDPAAARRATQAVDEAGTSKPSDVPVSSANPVRPPANEADRRLDSQSVSPGEPSTLPSEQLRRAADEAEAEATRKAREGLATNRAEGADAARDANIDNTSQIDKTPAVIATIKAPQSVDADGDAVRTTLAISGDTVAMHVDHRGEDVAYPIAADPIVAIEVADYRIAWFPILRQETYLHHWEQALVYVGAWHPVYCSMGMSCAYAAPAWWYVGWAGNTYAAYWPTWNWGPVWQQYWYPVYATRLVVDAWIPYWEPYLKTEYVELDANFSDAPNGEDNDVWETGARLAQGDEATATDALSLSDDAPVAQARSAALGEPLFSCFTRANIKQFVFQRALPLPNSTGVRARGTSSCGLLPVTTLGIPRIQAYTSGREQAGGSPCTAVAGGSCVITSRLLAPDRKRRFYTFVMKYFRYGPPGSKWRRTADTSGIDLKDCEGYGTPALSCTYYRFFAIGIR